RQFSHSLPLEATRLRRVPQLSWGQPNCRGTTHRSEKVEDCRKEVSRVSVVSKTTWRRLADSACCPLPLSVCRTRQRRLRCAPAPSDSIRRTCRIPGMVNRLFSSFREWASLLVGGRSRKALLRALW